MFLLKHGLRRTGAAFAALTAAIIGWAVAERVGFPTDNTPERTSVEAARAGWIFHVIDNRGNGADGVHLPVGARGKGGDVGRVAAGGDTRPIRGVEFVKLADLPSLGFSERFGALAMAGFPGAGSYMGSKAAIGL